jgi:DNA-binding transcriptional MocR family regulator
VGFASWVRSASTLLTSPASQALTSSSTTIAREKRNDDMAGVTLSQLVIARYLAAGEYGALLEDAVAFHQERCEVLLDAVDKHLAGLATSTRPGGGAHCGSSSPTASTSGTCTRRRAARASRSCLAPR